MADRVLIPLPDGRWLTLPVETFNEAVAAGGTVASTPTVATAEERLLTADELAERTSVPASWWEAAARRNEVPHRRIGKYVRFVFAEVQDTFRPKPTDLDSALAFRRRLKTGG